MFYAIFITSFVHGKSECIVPDCETCSPFSAEICINCNQGFTRDKYEGCIEPKKLDCPDNNCLDKTIPFVIENCAQYSSLSECLQCESGYELINGRCSPLCHDYCLCFDPYECFESSYRKLATCSKSNCDSCCSGSSDTCCLCSYGYGLSYFGYCYSCLNSNCLSCYDDYSVCTLCKTGYNLTSSGGCVSQCASGYGLSGTYCTKCSDTNCALCSSNYLSCTSCTSGYFLNSNKMCELYNCYDSNCKTCYSYYTCSVCYSGYYVSGGSCLSSSSSCGSNCLSCSSSSYCSTCKTGYYLSYGSCSSCS